MIELADERPVYRGPKMSLIITDDEPRISLTLRQLAQRFCDEDEATKDLTSERALEYRMFLSRFLIFVSENGYDL